MIWRKQPKQPEHSAPPRKSKGEAVSTQPGFAGLRRHTILRIPLKREQKAWSRCMHRRSEKASESLTELLMEGISLPKPISKDKRK